MSVSCKCCVLSGRGLCAGLATVPEESYRMWCVWVWSCILDNEEAVAHWGCCAMEKINENCEHKLIFCAPFCTERVR
jgi:hypothetical protein